MVASLRRMDPHPDWKDPASTALAISPDGERLAIGYDDGLVRLLSRSGALLKSLRGHGRSVVRALAFTPDSRRLLSACDDGTTRVWDSRIGEEAEVAHGRWANLFFPIFSNDGQTLVANVSGPHYPNGEAITFRDPSDGRALKTFDIRATIGFVSGDVVLALSPDGSTLAVAHIHDGCAQLLDAKTGRTKLRLMAPKGHVIASIRFSPNGTKVVTYSSSPGASYWMDEDISACIWDARDGRRLAVLKDSEPEVTRAVLGVAFTPDGQRLATASGDHTARIWNVDTGREQLVLRGHQAELYAVSFTDDGRRVATVSGDGTARIWDASTGRELSRMALEGHEGRIVGAALSPGGTHIVTFGEDQTARLWDGLTGRLLGTLIKHVKGIRSAVFSPNGQIVAVTLGGDPVMTHAWPVDFLSAARARSPRELTLAERARFELPAP
jgi:WD40 repeat protein